ncbi:MAG: hypothetical protein M3O46_12330 [Myxococcota bacterium]|nr:hypothetical protein [Myxococcota bacterium]
MQLSSTARSFIRCAPLLVLTSAVALAASCAKAPPISSFTNTGGDDSGLPSDDGSSGGPGPGDATVSGGDASQIMFFPDGSAMKCNPAIPCRDFPDPIFEGNAPMTAPGMFGNAASGSTTGGPCLAEPADGALVPKNWLRPRILWTSTSQDLFEVRVHSDGEAKDYVVYTTNHHTTMPKDLWQTIAWTPPQNGMSAKEGNLVGRTLTVTVRGMSSAGGTPTVSNTASFTIAPAIADGALVYWTTGSFDNNATNTTLQGFHVGDEGTTSALTASQVQQPVRAVPVPDGGVPPPSLTGNFTQVFCIGCHTATPDGKYVAFTAQWPWPNTLASIEAATPGAVPPWMSKGAVQNLSPDYRGNAYDTWYNPPAVNQIMLGIGAFSSAHYATGDRMYIATLGTSWNSFALGDPGVASGVTSQLAWFNLEWDNATSMAGGLIAAGLPAATPCTQSTYPGIMGSAQPCQTAPASDGGWGIIARTGDNNGAGAPSWSHNVDGNTDVIAYASTNVGVKDGRMDCSISASCLSDVFVVAYNSNGPGLGGKGGPAKGLPGASDPAFNEYYPAWSPDDQLVAFNRVPAGTSMYNEKQADVYVVPYNGGMGASPPHRLVANDPVACTGAMPHAVQNTWPKWAPNPLDIATGKPVPQKDAGGNTYYWITFSSTRSPTAPTDPRNGNKRKQQLYVAGVVVAPDGSIKSYAPIYLWNQDFSVNNLIPAWGEFSIPPGNNPPPDAGMAF